MYFLVCMVFGRKRLFCGCGNEIVVFRVKKNLEIDIEC